MTRRPQPRRRGTLLAASLIATVLCAGCGETHFPTKLGPARPLTVAVTGAPSALYAPLYAARANGDFRLGALAVTITRGSASSALEDLESHRAAIAIVSEPQLLAARDGGARLVAIGALVRQPLDGIVSLSTHAIASVAGLSKRTLAVAPGAFVAAELASVLDRANLAPGSVKRVPLGTDAVGALGRGSVAATLGANWAIAGAALAQRHQKAHVLQIQELGVPGYSQLVLAVRVDEARYNAPLLRAFLQSLTRGERAVRSNPEATAAMLARANPKLSRAFERSLLSKILPLTQPRDPKRPFGYQDPYAWQAFGAWMKRHGLISDGADSGLAITDEFLPGLGETTVTGD